MIEKLPMNAVRYFFFLISISFPLASPAENNEACNYTQCYNFLSEKRVQEAIAACTQAAEEGGLDVAVLLGEVYEEGFSDLEPNYWEAVKWYRYGAERGAYTAQLSLGMMYYHGKGVMKNLVEAFAWMDVGSSSGDPYVMNERDKVAAMLSEEQLAEARALSARYEKLFSNLSPLVHCGKQLGSPITGK